MRKDNDVKIAHIAYPFWFGGTASCMATLFTHPLDLGEFFSTFHMSKKYEKKIKTTRIIFAR